MPGWSAPNLSLKSVEATPFCKWGHSNCQRFSLPWLEWTQCTPRPSSVYHEYACDPFKSVSFSRCTLIVDSVYHEQASALQNKQKSVPRGRHHELHHAHYQPWTLKHISGQVMPSKGLGMLRIAAISMLLLQHHWNSICCIPVKALCSWTCLCCTLPPAPHGHRLEGCTVHVNAAGVEFATFLLGGPQEPFIVHSQ